MESEREIKKKNAEGSFSETSASVYFRYSKKKGRQ